MMYSGMSFESQLFEKIRKESNTLKTVRISKLSVNSLICSTVSTPLRTKLKITHQGIVRQIFYAWANDLASGGAFGVTTSMHGGQLFFINLDYSSCVEQVH